MKIQLLLFSFLLIQHHAYSQSEIKHRVYDTEFGRFDVWVYGNQVTGSYEIAPKEIIGSILTELNESKAVGRWTDPDGQGDIEITFEDGFQKLHADYRSDNDPDKWYRDQWHGVLRGSDKTESPLFWAFLRINPTIYWYLGGIRVGQ